MSYIKKKRIFYLIRIVRDDTIVLQFKIRQVHFAQDFLSGDSLGGEGVREGHPWKQLCKVACKMMLCLTTL